MIAQAEPLMARAEALQDDYVAVLARGASPGQPQPDVAQLQAAIRPLGRVLDELVQAASASAASARG